MSAPDAADVRLLVQRLPGERRCTPDTLTLDPLRGVLGDRWSLGKAPDPEAMVTLMRWDIAERLAAQAGVPVALLGDNLFASLDTSAANLPPGTRLRVGTAMCEVTPKPHRGCSKFAARVGLDALKMTASRPLEQLRGVHLRVLDGGEVRLGDTLTVMSRGPR